LTELLASYANDARSSLEQRRGSHHHSQQGEQWNAPVCKHRWPVEFSSPFQDLVQSIEAEFEGDLCEADRSLIRQAIRSACPTQVASTAPGRLAAMQQRIEAMISAVALVRPPLEKSYGLLDDEQKTRLNALAEDQRNASASKVSLAQNCAAAQPAAFHWPGSELEARLHLNVTQRALAVVQEATAMAADMVKVTCQPGDVVTPPARLIALAKRLDTVLQALKLVRPALESFFATLSDEQKAQFEAIGPKRTA
jgi:hypothetical protein